MVKSEIMPFLVHKMNACHSPLDTQDKNLELYQVNYSLKAPTPIPLKLGDYLKISPTGKYQCLTCDKITKKIYSGFCYICLQTKASADLCMMSPHLCHYAAQTCREPQWAETFCFQPHVVYLAYTDKFKVGITRESQTKTRWTDQGALMAAPICKVPSRHTSGIVEKHLKQFISDKSHWQKMLKQGNEAPSQSSFAEEWEKIMKIVTDFIPTLETKIDIYADLKITSLTYPLGQFESKFQSHSLEKHGSISGEIKGIKGQYIFLDDKVFQIRNHEGSLIHLEIT